MEVIFDAIYEESCSYGCTCNYNFYCGNADVACQGQND